MFDAAEYPASPRLAAGIGRRPVFPLRVGVLTNPRSGGNRKKGAAFHRIVAGGDVLHRKTESRQELGGVLADLAREGVNLLVVNGGDGTVQAVLSEICGRAIFPTPPLLALLRAGTASMLARDAGLPGEPTTAMLRLLRNIETGAGFHVMERPVLQVQREGNPDLYGMFFGVGAICRGIELYHARFPSGRFRGEVVPAIILIRLLIAFLLKNRTLLPPLELNVAINDGPPEKRQGLFALVTTLDRVILGLHPWWGREAAPLRYTMVEADPDCVLRTFPRLLRGSRSAVTPRCTGCFSRNVHEVRLEFTGNFTLDGELFPVTASGGWVLIRPAGPISFLFG